MCELFFKCEKKTQYEHVFKRLQDDAKNTLLQYRFDKNAEQFVKDVHDAVQDQVNQIPRSNKVKQSEPRKDAVR